MWQLLRSFPAWILRRAMVLAVDHRSERSAKPRCSQQNLGASPGLGAALACLRLGTRAGTGSGCKQTGPWIQPCADPALANLPVRLFSEGWIAQFSSNFLLLSNFSERIRGKKLGKQNISNDREDEGKILVLWPKSQACRFPCWRVSYSPSFSLWCPFPQPFQPFLSAGNEQWLTHAVGNYLFKEDKVDAELTTVWLDWLCLPNSTSMVERQSISVAGAILLYKAQSHWIRSMVHPRLWRPGRIFCGRRCYWEKWNQVTLSKGASHSMSWGTGSVQTGWYTGWG